MNGLEGTTAIPYPVVCCIIQPLVSGHLPLVDRYAWSQGCPLTGGLTEYTL